MRRFVGHGWGIGTVQTTQHKSTSWSRVLGSCCFRLSLKLLDSCLKLRDELVGLLELLLKPVALRHNSFVLSRGG